MSSIIKIKRSTTSGSVPSGLQEGELALNLFDRKIYAGNSSGVTAIGGEIFSVTSQTAGEGAYLKVNGETSSNSVLLRGGTGVTVAKDANGSISVTSTLGGDISALETNVSQKLGATASVTLTGDVTGSGSFSSNAVSIALTDTNLANTNAYIATKLDSSSYTTADVQSKAALANTNAYIATKLDSSSYTTGDVQSKAALANTNAYIADTYSYASSKLGGTATVTLTGDITGTASFSSNSVSIATTYNNDVVLGTDTSGNYAASVSGTTNEIEVTGSAGEGTAFQIGLPNDVTIGNDLTVSNDLGVAGNVTIDGNLTVEGGVTYISSSTVNVDDTMLKLSANNVGNSVDHGVYAKYVDGATTKYSGYFRDASDSDVFKFYTGLQTEPTTTVDTGATGYTLAQIDAVIDGGTY